MEEKFRQSLQQMKQVGTKQDLYGVSWFYPAQQKAALEETLPPKKEIEVKKVNAADLELSLEQIPEVDKKSAPTDAAHQVVTTLDLEQLIMNSTKLYGQNSSSLRLHSNRPLKVFFVGEKIQATDQSVDEATRAVDTLYQKSIADLFANMIQAMKLVEQQYLIGAVGDDDAQIQQLLQEICFYSPDYIITLGASPMQLLTKTKSKLREEHGKLFPISINDQRFELLPIFSPLLLGSAPNMKRVAWQDMQKVMKRLEET